MQETFHLKVIMELIKCRMKLRQKTRKSRNHKIRAVIFNASNKKFSASLSREALNFYKKTPNNLHL